MSVASIDLERYESDAEFKKRYGRAADSPIEAIVDDLSTYALEAAGRMMRSGHIVGR